MDTHDQETAQGSGMGWLLAFGGLVLAVIVLVPVAVVTIPVLMIAMLGASNDSNIGCQNTASGVAGAVDAGGPVRVPIEGKYTATSEFGMRRHPVTGVFKLHDGLDIASLEQSKNILAMKDGVVVDTPVTEWGGNMVIIDHGGAVKSQYLHMSQVTARKGQHVRTGERIGVEGSTGWVTGSHLHWTVFVADVPVDPRQWIEKQGVKVTGDAGPATAATGAAPSSTANDGGAGLPAQVGAWKGVQIANAAQIIAAGRALNLDDWSITVGVMTAMGESSLSTEVGKHGDAAGPDSRGLFQQRANGAWGSESDRMDPKISATNFFKALRKVDGYRQLAPTVAAHKVQANQDPHHYERHWADAVQVVAAITKNPDALAGLDTTGDVADCNAAAGTNPSGSQSLPPGPDGECTPTDSPGEKGLNPPALLTLRCVKQAFPQIKTMYGTGDRVGASDHPNGDAVDFMLDDWRTPEGRNRGWQIAHWVRANKDQLGVKYVIYDMKIWSVARTTEEWRPYTRYGNTPDDTLAHRDHVHVSLDPTF